MFKYLLSIVVILFSINTFAQDFSKNWLTEFEKSEYKSTADYKSSIKYFDQFMQFKNVYKGSFGISPQGRDLVYYVYAKDSVHLAEIPIFNQEKQVVFIQNGIHAGEIEGKDACMMLLREIFVTQEKSNYLDNVILVVVPIFNVDGHERKSPFNRINQDGPNEMGWRTTAQNYNLNRDYIKADSPEMQGLLKLYNAWRPDIYIDTHTTNGADYQYTITYDVTKYYNTPSSIRKIMRNDFIPYVEEYVNNKGVDIGPYVGFVKGDPKNGLRDWVAGPRFSQGYAAVQGRAGVLIETHMLKPYKDRVFATKYLLEAIIEFVSENAETMHDVNVKADEEIRKLYVEGNEKYPVKFSITKESEKRVFKGIEYENRYSEIAGDSVKFFTGEKFEIETDYFNTDSVTLKLEIPKAYLIPLEYSWIIEKLKLHGVKSKLVYLTDAEVVETKFSNVKFGRAPYESHIRTSFDYESYSKIVPGLNQFWYVSTAQKSIGVIIHMLEPDCDDSLVKWGFLNHIFERKEYFEMYSMEPIAKQMAEDNPELKAEFEKALENDEQLRKSAWLRLNWFYERSPYYDQKHNVYPILKIMK